MNKNKGYVPISLNKDLFLKYFDGIIVACIGLFVIIRITGGLNFIALKDPRIIVCLLLIVLLIRKVFYPTSSIFKTYWIQGIQHIWNRISNRPKVTLAVFVILYATLFSWISIKKHMTFHTNAFDLGIYDQVTWSLSHNLSSHYTIEEGPLGQYFWGVHFCPTLLLFAAFYHFYDSPIILLIIQSIVLAFGAVAIYQISLMEKLEQSMALFLATLYLCYQPLRNTNLFDFHIDTVLTSLLLFLYLWILQDKYWKAAIVLVLALGCKEIINVVYLFLGIYMLFSKKKRGIGIAIALIGGILFYLEIYHIMPYISGKPYRYLTQYTMGGGVWGPFNILVSQSPKIIFSKIKYLLQTLGPVGFLPIFAPSELFLTIPTYLQNLLTSSYNIYSIKFQYTATLTPFIFISLITAFSKLKDGKSWYQRYFSYSPSVSVLVFWLVVCSGIMITWNGSPVRLLRQYTITSHDALVLSYLQRIPKSASVSAQGGIVPHLSHRDKIYQFPEVYDSEYVVLDKTGNKWPLSEQEYTAKVNALLSNPQYMVDLSEDGFIILHLQHK